MTPWSNSNQAQPSADQASESYSTKGIYGLEVCHDDDQAVTEYVVLPINCPMIAIPYELCDGWLYMGTWRRIESSQIVLWRYTGSGILGAD